RMASAALDWLARLAVRGTRLRLGHLRRDDPPRRLVRRLVSPGPFAGGGGSERIDGLIRISPPQARLRDLRRYQTDAALRLASERGRPMYFLHLPMLRAMLLAAHRVLQAADGILHFSLHLIGLSFGLGFLIARRLAAPFLRFPPWPVRRNL